MPQPARRPKHILRSKDRASYYHVDRKPQARMELMASRHQDVLQGIEAVLVNAAEASDEVDDQKVSAALKAAEAGAAPSDGVVRGLVVLLEDVRAARPDLAQDVWLECLRVVRESVRRHSDLQPGARGYLDFAARFLD